MLVHTARSGRPVLVVRLRLLHLVERSCLRHHLRRPAVGSRPFLRVFFLLHLFYIAHHIGRRLVRALTAVVELLFVGRAALSKNFEPEDQRLVSQRPVLRIEVWVGFEEDVCEADAEVGAVNVQVLLARHVHFLTARAKYFHARSRKLLREADRQHHLAVAEDALAHAEGA